MMAAEIGVSRQTLDNWAEKHPEFLDAITRALELSLAWWEGQGLKEIWSRDFNANAYRLQMINRFPEDWRDRQGVELKGLLGKVDLNRLPDHITERVANRESLVAVLATAAEESVKQLQAGDPEGPD